MRDQPNFEGRNQTSTAGLHRGSLSHIACMNKRQHNSSGAPKPAENDGATNTIR